MRVARRMRCIQTEKLLNAVDNRNWLILRNVETEANRTSLYSLYLSSNSPSLFARDQGEKALIPVR
jgi:hypothetical protein